MDQISFLTVAKEFQNLIAEEFPDDVIEEITSEHKQIAQLLLEKFHEVTFNYLFIDESENEEGKWLSLYLKYQ